MAVIGPFSSSECRVVFPAGERAGIVSMSMASSAPKLAEPFQYAFRNTSDEGYMFERVMRALKDKQLSDRDRRDRLCHRRRDLEGDGRERAAGDHEEVRHRREAQRHLPDAGLRLLGAGLAAGRPADRPDRGRLGTGAGDAAGAGTAAPGPQGPAGCRLDHRRSRARPADGQGRRRHHHPDHVLCRPQRPHQGVPGRVRQAREGGRARSHHGGAVRRRDLRHRAVLRARHEAGEGHRRSGEARRRAHRHQGRAAQDEELSGARRARSRSARTAMRSSRSM